MPPSPLRHGWHLLRLRVGDELPVAHRVVVDSEREQSVDKKPSARRASAIEAEDELVEVIREMSFVKATLMSTREPPLGERGDPVHTREHDMGGLPVALDVDRLVDVAVSDGWRIAGPGVGDERRPLFDVLGDETLERGRRRVGEHRHAAPTEPSGLSELDSHADQDLLALLAATTKAWFLATEVGFVDFDGAAELVAPGTDEHRTEPVQHGPGRLVGAELERALQAEGQDPSFAVANCQHTVNHTVSGVRRRSNKVPAVTAVLFAQHAHLYRPSATRQPPGF